MNDSTVVPSALSLSFSLLLSLFCIYCTWLQSVYSHTNTNKQMTKNRRGKKLKQITFSLARCPCRFAYSLLYRIFTEKICITYDSEQTKRQRIAHIHHARYSECFIVHNTLRFIHTPLAVIVGRIYVVVRLFACCILLLFYYYYYITRWSCVRARIQSSGFFFTESAWTRVYRPASVCASNHCDSIRTACWSDAFAIAKYSIHPSIHPCTCIYLCSHGEALVV